ncbi:neurotrypsin [Strongylocentrotus purpuratus]|uniref:Uncharacterized protein n=1 Tax=Strongylocentrotus purpuratus TaxID=7668 RepID=A0A7M7GHR8_STRPU|nr:neurotrypsin [Strongylocentrotus purpuratus]
MIKMESSQSMRVHIQSRRLALLLAAGWLVICAPKCWAGPEESSLLDPSRLAPMDNDVRLKGGTQPWEGRIEIYLKSSGEWHTHCNTPRREEFYHVVCRAIGFGAFVKDLGEKEFLKSSLVPLQGYFECNKDAADLRSCFFKEGNLCSNDEEAGITCSGKVPSCGPISFQKDDHMVMHPFKLSYPVDTRVKVRCPGDPSVSGVMKCVNGHWEWEGVEPPTCPPRIDDSITCPAPFIDTRNTFLRPWKLTYRYDETLEIVCTDRSNITRLRCGDGGRLECLDGGEECIPEAPICQTPNRAYGDEKLLLVGGAKPTEGRVLVNRDGRWGSICADGWNQENANVICAQLGFGPARDSFHSTPQFPSDRSKRLYLFREVGCSSGDKNILGCSMKHMSAGDKCLSRHEVEVDCSSEKAEPQSNSCRTNCGPPGLPPNILAKPFKFVYQADEIVTLSCEGNSTKKVEIKCSANGLWSGSVIDCGRIVFREPEWLIGIGIGIVSLQVFMYIIWIIWCCCTRRRVPAVEVHVRDDAPPPENVAKVQPVNQQSVLTQRRTQTDDNKQD